MGPNAGLSADLSVGKNWGEQTTGLPDVEEPGEEAACRVAIIELALRGRGLPTANGYRHIIVPQQGTPSKVHKHNSRIRLGGSDLEGGLMQLWTPWISLATASAANVGELSVIPNQQAAEWIR